MVFRMKKNGDCVVHLYLKRLVLGGEHREDLK